MRNGTARRVRTLFVDNLHCSLKEFAVGWHDIATRQGHRLKFSTVQTHLSKMRGGNSRSILFFLEDGRAEITATLLGLTSAQFLAELGILPSATGAAP